MTVSGTKFSQIALSGSPPALTDTLVGVGPGPTDLRYTLAQIASGAGVTIGSSVAGGTPNEVLFVGPTGLLAQDVGFTFDSINKAATLASIANPAASTLTITGGTALTTSQPALNITQGWNNGAVTFTGLKFNVTASASAAASLLADLQVGGSSQFNVDKAGNLSVATSLGWTTSDLFLQRDAANILAIRNSTSAQTFRVYNTFTNSTNYERGIFDWNNTANVLTIGMEKGSGGGSARNIQFIIGTVPPVFDYGVTNAGCFNVGGTIPRIVIGATTPPAGIGIGIVANSSFGCEDTTGGSIYFDWPGTGYLQFRQSGSGASWAFDPNNFLIPLSDNAFDIGITATNRVRSVYAVDLYSSDATFLLRTKTTLTNNAAANLGTLTNAPAVGNPTKWIGIDDNGTTRFIPAW